MTAYRCRFVAPKQSDWSTVDADSPELAANEFHAGYENPHTTHAITYTPSEDKPGAKVHFARVEVEGFGSWVSRIYTSGILRAGGIKIRPTLAEVAKAVGWEHDPEDLIEDGWIGEQDGWAQ